MTGVVGASPALWYFRYIASIFFTLHKRLWFNCIKNIAYEPSAYHWSLRTGLSFHPLKVPLTSTNWFIVPYHWPTTDQYELVYRSIPLAYHWSVRTGLSFHCLDLPLIRSVVEILNWKRRKKDIYLCVTEQNRTEHNFYWCKIHIQRIVTKTTY